MIKIILLKFLIYGFTKIIGFKFDINSKGKFFPYELMVRKKMYFLKTEYRSR